MFQKRLIFPLYIGICVSAIYEKKAPTNCLRPIERNKTETCGLDQTMFFEKECLCCYYNQRGNPTIGVGFDLNREDSEDLLLEYDLRLLDVLADCRHKSTNYCLTNAQALDLLDGVSYQEAKKCVHNSLPDLPSPKFEAIVDVAFTVGCKALLAYKYFLDALKQKQWAEAAQRLLMTEWAGMVSEDRRTSNYNCIRGAACGESRLKFGGKEEEDCGESSTQTSQSTTTAASTIPEFTSTSTTLPTTVPAPRNISCETIVAYYVGNFKPDPESTEGAEYTFDAQFEVRVHSNKTDRRIHLSYPNLNQTYSQPNSIYINLDNGIYQSMCYDPSGEDLENCSLSFDEGTGIVQILVRDTIKDGIYDILYFDEFTGEFELVNATGQCTRDHLRNPDFSFFWPDTTQISYCVCCDSYSPQDFLECPVNPFEMREE